MSNAHASRNRKGGAAAKAEAERITPVGDERSFESWRESVHDDLMLATALAVWFGAHSPQPIRVIELNTILER